MNERIKELAERCWDTRLDGRHFDIEQFAELIVRECVSIADRRGAYEVMDDIIEHFGVE
jgi:hypothetical protein